MAEVVPFRAVRYDLSRAGAADSLIAPPYDVISESDRSVLQAKSPFNIVRVDRPQGDREQKYRDAARELRRWLEEGDPPPRRQSCLLPVPPDLLRRRARAHAQGLHLPHPAAPLRR